MKNILLLIAVWVAAASCVEKEVVPSVFIVGKWDLVQMEYFMTGESLDGEDLDRSVSYYFQKGGKFRKEVRSNGTFRQASGTYSTEEVPPYSSSDAQLYLKLLFTEGETIEETCGSLPEEELVLRWSNRISNYSSAPCDGPVSTFEKD